MRKFNSSVFCLALLIWTAPVFADARAEELLRQARTAIGGEEQLQKIQSLNINGQYRRMLGERQVGGDREISILLPNKYLIEDSFNMGGLSTPMISTRTLNGEHAWNSQSGGGGGMVFRMGGPGGQPATPEQMEAALRRIFQIEMARYLLAITLAPPASFAVEYKYVGESDVDDVKAEVIDVSGPDNFAVRLFFDKQSHLPLLVSYRGPKPRIMTMTRPAGGAAAKPEDVQKARDEAGKKLHAEAPQKPEEVDFYIRLSDHKRIGGLLLPHKFTFITENEVSEEFEISKYQMNPPFKLDKFDKH
ncbi:MAG TPA: hypothetical protein VGQ39_05760 [Pyrinomonadaceae bacterium]|jgi:hypothetical protein|nr:hypothetical protein [Pyrinomonadaceae bacterium]